MTMQSEKGIYFLLGLITVAILVLSRAETLDQRKRTYEKG